MISPLILLEIPDLYRTRCMLLVHLESNTHWPAWPGLAQFGPDRPGLALFGPVELTLMSGKD